MNITFGSLFKKSSSYEKMSDADEKQNEPVERKIKEIACSKFTQDFPETIKPGFHWTINFSTDTEATEHIKNDIAPILGKIYGRYLEKRPTPEEGMRYFDTEPTAFATAKKIEKFRKEFEKLLVKSFKKDVSSGKDFLISINPEVQTSSFCEIMKKCVVRTEIFRYFPLNVVLYINCSQSTKKLTVSWYQYPFLD